MKKTLIAAAALGIMNFGRAQTTQVEVDSSEILKEVVISAYEQNRKLLNIPAPVSFVGKSQLERYNNTSILPALNTIPGVRMEERSPGSYRLNIRGSSLRSPFGVRNVKVYWNEIPFTDPSGNSYFNQFSFYNFSSLEILKGPGSSLYGAGSGGVILAEGFDGNKSNEAKVEYTRGSFNSNNLYAGVV